jgi:hypothetical protein
MKAAVVHQFKAPLRLEEVPVPQPGLGEILVKVEAAGLCHTDIHAAHGDWPVKPKLPLIPGHEGVGIVTALGPGVAGVAEGDRVAIPWLGWACGACEYCASGWETLCPRQHRTGYSIDGSYAEYVKASASYVGHVPNGVDPFEAAPLTCAGVTTYKAVKLAKARPSDLVAVYGVGGLGHLTLQYAKIAGATVAAVDLVDDKLSLAREPRTRRPRSSGWAGLTPRSCRRSGRCARAAGWCWSGSPPTTRCGCRSLRPCRTTSRSSARSWGPGRIWPRCSSCTPAAAPNVTYQRRPLESVNQFFTEAVTVGLEPVRRTTSRSPAARAWPPGPGPPGRSHPPPQ